MKLEIKIQTYPPLCLLEDDSHSVCFPLDAIEAWGWRWSEIEEMIEIEIKEMELEVKQNEFSFSLILSSLELKVVKWRNGKKIGNKKKSLTAYTENF